MRKDSTTQSRKRSANRGSFRPGPDPRRHKFTPEECSQGFWTAIAVLGVSIGPKLHRAGRWPNFTGRRSSR
jgi:hypothetical protein